MPRSCSGCAFARARHDVSAAADFFPANLLCSVFPRLQTPLSRCSSAAGACSTLARLPRPCPPLFSPASCPVTFCCQNDVTLDGWALAAMRAQLTVAPGPCPTGPPSLLALPSAAMAACHEHCCWTLHIAGRIDNGIKKQVAGYTRDHWRDVAALGTGRAVNSSCEAAAHSLVIATCRWPCAACTVIHTLPTSKAPRCTIATKAGGKGANQRATCSHQRRAGKSHAHFKRRAGHSDCHSRNPAASLIACCYCQA